MSILLLHTVNVVRQAVQAIAELENAAFYALLIGMCNRSQPSRPALKHSRRTRVLGSWLQQAVLYIALFKSMMGVVHAAGPTPTQEYDALFALYTSTSGPHWQWQPTDVAGQVWNFTDGSDPCADLWQGITCSPLASVTHIQRLDLSGYSLIGTLPDALEELTHLTHLIVVGNDLYGTIPAHLGTALRNLTELNLNVNHLTGPIPPSLMLLRNLTSLQLGQNHLTGTIPNNLPVTLVVLELIHNHLAGSLPATVGALADLVTLDVQGNFITGLIPPELTNLRHLLVLNLYNNLFKGTIPEVLSQMRQLQILRLNFNVLTGTVPSSLADLTNLLTLDVSRNQLKGPLPPVLGSFPLLQELRVYSNHFTGPIPTTLANLQTLTVLDLSINKLTGPIPGLLGALQELTTFNVKGNRLTGTIPALAGAARSLQQVDVSVNELSGPIPMFASDLANLWFVSLYFNYLTGTLPDILCALRSVTVLYLDVNQFSGVIPPCLNLLQNLTYATFDNNDLTGTIPPGIYQLQNLEAVWLSYNQLTGKIPSFNALRQLTQLELAGNEFTGTLPASFSAPDTIQILSFSKNHLTGTIPQAYGHFPNLLAIAMSENYLTGCIPQSFANLGALMELYVQGNRLGCTLDGVFDPAAQHALSVIEINNNQLTGTIPRDIFELPKLSSFVALSNCFSGTLSPDICHSALLQALILDGLHTSKACRVSLVPFAHTYNVPRAVYGTIPACLFAMPTLASLHLSGNGYTGTIPDGVIINDELIDLTLSHNALTGTVPVSVQQHNWRTLDLSFNRLTGELLSSFGSALKPTIETFGNISVNSSQNNIAMQNNRLSGRVPTPLLALPDVTILGSNVFYCELDKHDLPANDVDRETYQCGSNAFDAPFYVVLIVIAASVALYLTQRHYSLLAEIFKWVQQWEVTASQLPRHLAYVFTALDVIVQMAFWCTLLILVVLVPWYATASHYFGTYKHQYAWVVSAAFLSGTAPAAVEFVLYVGLMLAFTRIVSAVIANMDKAERSRSRSSVRLSSATHGAPVVAQLPKWKRILVYVSFLAVNVFVVVGVNVGFVAVALTQNNGVLFLAQLVLSVFKLVWNTVCTPFLIYLATGYVTQNRSSVTFVTVQVYIGLFNNIAIPCLVVAVLSPSCFYSAFHAPNAVNSQFLVQSCRIEPSYIECAAAPPQLLHTSYNPPFRYDYQCSSAFITYYAPAFVYLGIAAGVLEPAAKLFVMWLRNRIKGRTYLRSFLSLFVPRLLRPIKASDLEATDAHAGSIKDQSQSWWSLFSVLWTNYKPYFDANNLIVIEITFLGILLTFGVVFPPIAVVMGLTIFSVSWQAKLSVARYLKLAAEAGAPHLQQRIEEESRGAITIIKLLRSVFAVITYCCGFYALFLFDTLGDAVGLKHADWTLIAMPLVAPVIFTAAYLRRNVFVQSESKTLGMSIDVGIYEMTERATQGLEMGTRDNVSDLESECGGNGKAESEEYRTPTARRSVSASTRGGASAGSKIVGGDNGRGSNGYNGRGEGEEGTELQGATRNVLHSVSGASPEKEL